MAKETLLFIAVVCNAATEPSQSPLEKLGMEPRLWDDVRQSNHQPLTAGDREAFYQLLAVLSRPEARDLHASAAALNVVPLLEQPVEHLGEIFPVRGTARRVTRITVSDPDIRSRFGIDHYYEIDLFVPLGDATLQFGADSTGEKNPVYRNKFPATLIVRDLPPDLPPGENVHEQIQADAVFFKIWTYRSSYTTRFGQLQPAPLFIAANVHVAPLATATNWVTSSLVLAAFAAALSTTGIIVWLYGKSDRTTVKDKATVKPDFTGLS